ncbi:MAG: energy transducer TonB [Terriglobales bacterium]
MHLSRSILVLAFAAFPVISWASAEPHSDHSPDSPLPPCSQSPDNRDAGGPRHSHYYLCELSNGAQALAADSTPPQIDTQHPFNADWKHYPEDSKIKREEGWCVVSFTVREDGRIDHGSTRLERSSDSVLLDFACLQAFRDGRLVPATQHGRRIAQRVGAVVVWVIEGPVPLRPKEHQIVSLCTKDSPILPVSTVPPVNGQSFLAAGKLAADKGWLLDPCFYRDDTLKQFFGATKIDRFYDRAHGQDQGRWEGINLVVPGSIFGHSEPGGFVVGLTITFSTSGITQSELRVSNFDVVTSPPTRDDVVKTYGVGREDIATMTDGGPSMEVLRYDAVGGGAHIQTSFLFDRTAVFLEIVTAEPLTMSTTDLPAHSTLRAVPAQTSPHLGPT